MGVGGDIKERFRNFTSLHGPSVPYKNSSVYVVSSLCRPFTLSFPTSCLGPTPAPRPTVLRLGPVPFCGRRRPISMTPWKLTRAPGRSYPVGTETGFPPTLRSNMLKPPPLHLLRTPGVYYDGEGEVRVEWGTPVRPVFEVPRGRRTPIGSSPSCSYLSESPGRTYRS